MSPLSHGELVQMETAAKNKQATVGPIVLTIKHRLEQSDEDIENLVMKAIYDVDVKIDKPQLIRAIELDKELREGKLVEVVRCRNCKYWDPGSPMATVIPTPCRCRLRRETDATTAEDFCSYGRRKANE